MAINRITILDKLHGFHYFFFSSQASGDDHGLAQGGGQPTVVTGSQLREMGDDQFAEAAASANVLARVTPEHKLRLISAYRQDGTPTAMTGDGVNDAPAMAAADG